MTTAPDGLNQLLARLDPVTRAALGAALQQGRLSTAELAQAWQACGASPVELSRWVTARLTGAVADTIVASPSGRLPAASSASGRVPAVTGGAQSRGLGEGPAPAGGPPQQVGPYQVVRELARGGMGVVFIARHAQLGRQVALKVLPRGASPEEGERFQLEAQSAARLKHPNIVGVHDVGVERGQPWLAMDLIEGETLHARIGRDGPLPEKDAAELLEKVARAMAFAHARGVLHRDIKPQNVLLDREGTPFLADFGLAKDVSQKEKGVTIQGQVIGTPAYMPPEQAAGESELVDRRADVYSLGATLYHALTGRAPFDGPTQMNIITKVLMSEPERPSKRRPRLDRDLETVCLHAMEKEIAARYQTAQAFADDLRRCVEGAPISARHVGAAERLWRRVRKNRALTAAAGAVALALLLVWAGMTVQLERSRDKERLAKGLAEEETRKATEAAANAAAAAVNAEAATQRAHAAQQQLVVERELDRGVMLLSLTRYAEAADTFWAAEQHAAALPHAELVGAARRGAGEARRHLGRRVRAGNSTEERDVRAYDCAFAPGGGSVLATIEDGALIVRDLRGGDELLRAQVGPCRSASLAFTPDGATLAATLNVGPNQSTEVAWEVSSGRERWRHDGVQRETTELAIDSSGAFLAIGDMQGVTTVVDPRTGQEVTRTLRLEPIVGPQSEPIPAYALAFAPAELGALLTVGYANGLIVDWFLTKGEARARNVSVAFNALAWAATDAVVPGKLILIGGNQNGQVLAWSYDPATHEYEVTGELLHGEEGQVRSVAVRPASPGNEGLIAATTEGGTAWVWDGSLRLRRLIHTGDDDAKSCAFSPDGGELVTAGPRPALAWDPGPRRFPGHGPVAFSWTGDELAVCRRRPRVLKVVELSGGRRGEMYDTGFDVSRYDLESGAERGTIELPNEYGVLVLSAMDMTPDGDVVVATGEDHELFKHRRLWVWSGGRSPKKVIDTGRAGESIAVAADGATLLLGQVVNPHDEDRQGDVERWSLRDGERQARFVWHSRSVIACQLLPDGGFVSAEVDGTWARWTADPAQKPRIFDAKTGRVVPWSEPEGRSPDSKMIGDRISAMSYSPERKLLALAFGDGRVRLWGDDRSPDDPPEELRGHEHELVLCAFVPGGDLLVTASREGKVRVWDVARGAVLRTIEPLVRRIEAAALSRDGQRLALASAGDVWVYSLAGD